MYPDLYEIQCAQDRLACFNGMLDLTNCGWSEKRPAADLQDIISTACHINKLLLEELKDITNRIDIEILEERIERDKEQATHKEYLDMAIGVIKEMFSYEDNVEYFKANSHGFSYEHFSEDAHLFGGILTGFLTGREYEKTVVGGGEDAKKYLARWIAVRDEMIAGKAGIMKADTGSSQAAADTDAGDTPTVAGMEADHPRADAGAGKSGAA